MERELFDWLEGDQLDTMLFNYSGAVLKVTIGNFHPGQKFASICVNYETGILSLYLDPESKKHFDFALNLQVGAEILTEGDQ